MSGARSFSLANKIAIVVTILLLVGIFYFAHSYTQSLKTETVALALRAKSAVLSENWDEARQSLDAIDSRLSASYDTLKLFYNHEDIDTLETEMDICLSLALVEDAPELLPSLERLISIVTFLAGIETFTIPNLF